MAHRLLLPTLLVAVPVLSLGVADVSVLLPGVVGALMLVSALGAVLAVRETRPGRRVIAAVAGAYVGTLAAAAPAAVLAVAAMLAQPALLALLLVPLAAGLVVGFEPDPIPA
jgi:hypothetical protein